MRIWDIPPQRLCRQHLLAEHRELHGVWATLTQGKRGYAHHPEVRRWRGKLKALYLRHESLIAEMERRGYTHQTPLPADLAVGQGVQTEFLASVEEQVQILKDKGCDCAV